MSRVRLSVKRLGAALFLATLATAGSATAQDLVISNARIIVGPGKVIERGVFGGEERTY